MNLKLSSDRQYAQKEWPESFGTYRYYTKDAHGALVWRLLNTNHERYLVRDYKFNVWKIFDRYLDYDHAYISRYYRDHNFCPEYSQQGNWVFYNNTAGKNFFDPSIRMHCEDDNVIHRELQTHSIRRNEGDLPLRLAPNYASSIEDSPGYTD